MSRDRLLVIDADLPKRLVLRTWRDGLDGPDLPPPSRGPEPSHAIDWIATMLAANEDPVTLVATAPLTNVALFLARYPELATRFERIVVMGGAIGDGNETVQRLV